MKLKHQIAMVAILTAVVGCDRNNQTQNQKQSDAAAAPKEVQEQPKDSAAVTPPAQPKVTPAPDQTSIAPARDAAKPYATDNKDEFVLSMDQKLKDLEAKIDDLAKKSEAYKDDAKVQAEKALAELRTQRDKAKEKFEEAKKASAETWKDIKAEFASVMDELEKAYENAKSQFN